LLEEYARYKGYDLRKNRSFIDEEFADLVSGLLINTNGLSVENLNFLKSQSFFIPVYDRIDMAIEEIQDNVTRLRTRIARKDEDREITQDMRRVLDNSFVIIPKQKHVDILTGDGQYFRWESSVSGAISVNALANEGTWIQGFLPGVGDGDPVWIDMSSVYETFPYSFGRHTDMLEKALGILPNDVE
jgi:hypothetical protein